MTALMLAARGAAEVHVQVVRLLCHCRADVYARSRKGCTALAIAVEQAGRERSQANQAGARCPQARDAHNSVAPTPPARRHRACTMSPMSQMRREASGPDGAALGGETVFDLLSHAADVERARPTAVRTESRSRTRRG